MVGWAARDLVRNRALWVMLALPTGVFWTVARTGQSARGPWFLSSWLLFAEVMTGLMITSSHWLEEREQGTWSFLRTTPVPVGWMLAAQVLFVGVLTLFSQMGVLGAQGRSVEPGGVLVLDMMAGGLLFATLGVVIALASPSARSGSLVAAGVMVVLFLTALIAPGLEREPGPAALVRWMPSVLMAHALARGVSGSLPAPPVTAGILGWGLLLVAISGALVRREYTRGTSL